MSRGRVLLVKLVLVVLAMTWGASHRLLVRPRLERGATPSGRFGLLGESLVGVAVLLAIAILLKTAPSEEFRPLPSTLTRNCLDP